MPVRDQHGPAGLGCVGPAAARPRSTIATPERVGSPRAPTCTFYRVLGGPGGPTMQSLQRVGACGAQDCNPYSVLGPRGTRDATPTAFWGSGAPNMQPLQRCEALRAQTCELYNVLGPWGANNVSPTTCWGPGEPKMRSLRRFGAPGTQECNVYSVLPPPPHPRGRGGLRPLQCVGPSRDQTCDPYNTLGPWGLKIATPTTL